MSIRKLFTTLAAGAVLTFGSLGLAGCQDEVTAQGSDNGATVQQVSQQFEEAALTQAAQAPAQQQITAPILRAGTKGTPQEMGAVMRQERHSPQATMNHATFDENANPIDVFANILTASPDRSTWYLMQSNNPTGVQATEMTVRYSGVNLRLYDYKRTDFPTISEHNFDQDKAEDAIADRDEEGLKFYDDMIRTSATINSDSSVLFEGDIYDHEARSVSGTFTLIYSESNKRATLLVTDLDGVTQFAGLAPTFKLERSVVRDVAQLHRENQQRLPANSFSMR